VKIFAALLLAILLAGCAALPTVTSKHPQTVAELDNWALNGRVSLTQGETGWHAGLTWREHDGEYVLRVIGPLGQGAFEVSGDDAGVLLIDADGRAFTARDADALLQHVTGWILPVSGMHYWVRGLVMPGVEAKLERNSAGLVSHLNQSGWAISYDRYRSVAGLALPGRLQMERDGVAVRLVVDEWLLDGDTKPEP
jgi:outer membrane lipoprotein LolB